MRARTLTAVDVCEVTGYSRNQLRGLIDELPVYAEQETTARVAREFSPADLLILSVVSVLETTYNIKRAAVASVAETLRKTLSGPRPVNRNARLLISLDPPSVSYFSGTVPSQDGILISLGRIFERVDRYLNYGLPSAENREPELKLGPTLISGRRKKAAQ